ncbi:TetR/AcrR family transcriptional regulator [Niallia sp. Krafla_26]|uniref:TetR/AcrR family transcriptional regulator n=1 Tax=Niallia sp. Krafla_26 TaxID=3064703 RepID=UPI003D163AA3
MEQILDTRERILQATIELIMEKGFKGATTRAIAQKAGVNEITLFRHFNNKKGIVKAVIEKVSYVPSLSKVLKEKVEWDLEKDLMMFSKLYQQLLDENRDLIMIGLKEAALFSELQQQMTDIPRQLKERLMEYLNSMREKGILIETNVEAQAMALIWMNFSFFMSRSQHDNKITDLTEEEFLKNTVSVLARGLTL